MLPITTLAVTYAAYLIGILLGMGILLLLFALRGKRVGDAQHCRKCEFNLTGLTETAATCPECGSVLSSPNATAIGEHRRPRWRFVFAITCWLLAAVLLVHGQYQVDIYSKLPTALLMQMTTSDAARDELAVRVEDGKTSAEVAIELAETALQVQGDRNRVWHESWGRLIEVALDRNLLTQEQAMQYAMQAGNFSLRCREQVQQGRNIVLLAEADKAPRIGPDTSIGGKLMGPQVIANGKEMRPLRNLGYATQWEWTKGQNRGGGSYHMPIPTSDFDVGKLTIKFEATPTCTILTKKFVSSELQTKPIQLAINAQIVEGPTGHYLSRGELSLEEYQTNAGVWICRDYRRNRTLLKIGVVGIENWQSPQLLVVADGKIVNFLGWSEMSSSSDGQVERICWAYTFKDIRQQLPDANTIDIVMRTDVLRLETYPHDPGKPQWLGEIRFHDVPLDAEPIDFDFHSDESIPESLVPAEARHLEFEQMEQPPPSLPDARTQ